MDIAQKAKLIETANEHAKQLVQKLHEIYTQLQVDKNQETKNTSGDKHEVGRAMVQLEEEKLQKQITEAQKNLAILARLKNKTCNTVQLGAYVHTNYGHLFISCAIGKLVLNKTEIMCISMHAPLAQALLNNPVGKTIPFNGKNIEIISIT